MLFPELPIGPMMSNLREQFYPGQALGPGSPYLCAGGCEKGIERNTKQRGC